MVANETRQRLSVGLGIAASHEMVAKSSGLAPAGFGLPLTRARLLRTCATTSKPASQRVACGTRSLKMPRYMYLYIYSKSCGERTISW